MTIATGSAALAADLLKSHGANGYLDFASSTVLTIASGVITNTQNFHRVAGEGAAADDLVTITAAADVTDGYVLILRPSSDSVTITVKNGSGNIQCVGNTDLVLDDDHDFLICIYDGNLSAWMAQMASLPAAGTSGNILRDNGTQFVSSNIGVPVITRKTANESVTSSTTLQNDDHLLQAINASEVWEVRFYLGLSNGGGTTGGFKWAVTVPTSATMLAAVQWAQSTTSVAGNTATSGTAFGGNNGVNSATGHALISVYVINSTNAGNIQLQWAQNTSDGVASTILANSYMIATRIS